MYGVPKERPWAFHGIVYLSTSSHDQVDALFLRVVGSKLSSDPIDWTELNINWHTPASHRSTPTQPKSLCARGPENLGVNGVEDEAVVIVPAVFRSLREHTSLSRGGPGHDTASRERTFGFTCHSILKSDAVFSGMLR